MEISENPREVEEQMSKPSELSKESDLCILSVSEQSGMKVVSKEEPQADEMIRFLPVKDISVDVHIQDGVAVISMVHQYYNPEEEKLRGDGNEQVKLEENG